MIIRNTMLVRLGTFGMLISVFATPPLLADQAMKDVLAAYIEVWNGGDLDNLDNLVTDVVVRHGGFGPAQSRAELRRVIERSRAFYRDLNMDIQQMVASPEKGAIRSRFTAGWGQTRFAMDSISYTMYHFTDGKISAEWVHGNTMDLFRTFGYTLTPPHYTLVPPPIEEERGPTLGERMAPDAAALEKLAESSASAASKGSARLDITTDVGCRLAIDRSPIGWLDAGETVALYLDPGKHFLEASSAGGSVFSAHELDVRKGKTADLAISAPARAIVKTLHRTTEDLSTGLVWQMTDGGENIRWDAAKTHCADLEQGGHDDWRLPTIHELQSIHTTDTADSKRYHSIEGILLTDCCPWSSSPHGDYVWTYAFSMDMLYLQYETLGYHMRVLCVRDAAIPQIH